MSDELHPVVTLLLKRMESHPEEFGTGPTNRWGWMLNDVLSNCSTEEAEAINKGLRPIRLQEIHESVMDELLNGDERRRREMEEAEYEKQLLQQAKTAKAVLLSQQQQQSHEIMRLNSTGSIGIGNVTPSHPLVVKTPSRHPKSSDMEKNGIMNALRNIMK